MIKIRLRKQRDILKVSLFGYSNFIMMLDQVLIRFCAPVFFLLSMIYFAMTDPFTTSRVLTFMYWMHVWETMIRLLAANDILGVPRMSTILLAPICPLYRIALYLSLLPPVIKELLRIGLRHGYVPERIWKQTTHW